VPVSGTVDSIVTNHQGLVLVKDFGWSASRVEVVLTLSSIPSTSSPLQWGQADSTNNKVCNEPEKVRDSSIATIRSVLKNSKFIQFLIGQPTIVTVRSH
jgi:hypothetical protein